MADQGTLGGRNDMMQASNAPSLIAQTSSVEPIAFELLESKVVRIGVDCWTKHRRGRRFPARHDIQPRELAGALRNMILLRVIDSGVDFENRIVGDAQVRAFAIPLQRRRFSEVAADAPVFGFVVGGLLEGVVQKREPVAIRGRVGRDIPQANFTDTESAILPLGATDDAVDHIAVFSSYVMRGTSTYSM
ncbi:MAG: PAS domain-containing protein [Alphaproteobacteria bacterium]|nr:PAS domain-containing protein [Alphaproteobacteria bacterium]